MENTSHYPGVPRLIGLARDAGAIMKRHFGPGMERTIKDDKTPVTFADLEVNNLVTDYMEKRFPHVNVISEEGNRYVADAEYTVLCDPVDGTIPFSRGIPISTFVISVLRDNKPIAAVIHDPFMDRTWHAIRGGGATLTGENYHIPLRVSRTASLEHSNICMVWWKGSRVNLHQPAATLANKGAVWMNPLSIAYFGGLLAAGELEATVFPGLQGWETAAMQLIVEEAGGKVTDIFGKPMVYGLKGEISGHIMSNGQGAIHDEIVAAVMDSIPGL